MSKGLFYLAGKAIKAALKPAPKAAGPAAQPAPSITFVSRLGYEVVADEVFRARTSGDLPRMLAAVEIKTNPIDRYFLLAAITEQTYKLRADPEMARLCEEMASIHLKEMARLSAPLRKQNDGQQVTIKCFSRLATVLAERGAAAEAIKVAQKAFKYEQTDEAGLTRWIKRIERTAEKHHIKFKENK